MKGRHLQRVTDILAKVILEMNASSQMSVDGPVKTAQAVVDAMNSFLHPLLVEQRLKDQNCVDMALKSQIKFVLCALGVREVCFDEVCN